MLRYLDYDLIGANPKVFCGFSDITALGTAIYAKTGTVTYSGPHFSTFGMEKGLEYTLEYFKKCLMDTEPVTVEPSIIGVMTVGIEINETEALFLMMDFRW